MKVYIERKFAALDFNIFMVERSGKWNHIWRWDGEQWAMEEYDPAVADLKPSLVLPAEALEEIIRAAEGHVHAQDATVRHLDDATATRDRLLAMVEKRGLR